MHAIVLAAASIAMMCGLWLIAWVLWRLPLALRSHVPTPTPAPMPLAETTPHQSSTASLSRPRAAQSDQYAQDKAKTAFFERRKPLQPPPGQGT